MNTVILTSVLSAGNHALFAGTRVLYGLSTTTPVPRAPRFFSRTTKAGVPLASLLATSSVSVICFGTSFIGSGELWGWLQNIVGVSNQVNESSVEVWRNLTNLVDRLVVYWARELEISKSMATTGSFAERNEVQSELDMALGTSVRRKFIQVVIVPDEP